MSLLASFPGLHIQLGGAWEWGWLLQLLCLIPNASLVVLSLLGKTASLYGTCITKFVGSIWPVVIGKVNEILKLYIQITRLRDWLLLRVCPVLLFFVTAALHSGSFLLGRKSKCSLCIFDFLPNIYTSSCSGLSFCFSPHGTKWKGSVRPQHAPANFSTRAVSSLLLPHTSCISQCTILWNVNFIMCAWSLSYPSEEEPERMETEWNVILHTDHEGRVNEGRVNVEGKSALFFMSLC